MESSDEDCGRSTRSGEKDRGWSSTGRVLGARTIGRSSNAVYDLYRVYVDEEHEFLG
jgi:hypothetical protein